MALVEVSGRVNEAQIDFTSVEARRAVMRAGSDALLAARAEAVREVRRRRNIRAKDVRRAITLRYAERDSSATVLSWGVRVSREPLPVMAYGPRQVRAGVAVEIKAGRRAVIRHAFIATGGALGKHRGVFLRYGPYRLVTKGRFAGTNVKRQAIRELYTTTVLDVFTDPDFAEKVGERAKAVFRRSFFRNFYGSGRGA